ncbi:hypothetical protein [Azospirillum endophyticum]
MRRAWRKRFRPSLPTPEGVAPRSGNTLPQGRAASAALSFRRTGRSKPAAHAVRRSNPCAAFRIIVD